MSSEKVIFQKGGLEYREQYGHNSSGTHFYVVMKKCPCGYEFDHKENRPYHFLKEHTPEDFGLGL